MFVSNRKVLLLLLVLLLPVGQVMALAMSSIETAPLAASNSFSHHHDGGKDVEPNNTLGLVDCEDGEHCEVHCHASLVFHLAIVDRFSLPFLTADHPQFRLGFFAKRSSPPLLEPPIL
ncbi:MAG: hypothetical protein OXE99_06315 [Cellvibrionales bacterium]|nr:hypothetical protein [Cellvibrionales bacterium]